MKRISVLFFCLLAGQSFVHAEVIPLVEQGGEQEQEQEQVQAAAPVDARPLAEQRLESVLSASPQSILNMRKRIQDSAAAKRAPIQGDYDEAISQDILDLEDIFDITLEPGDLAPKVFISKFQSTAVSFVDAFGNPWPIRKVSNFMGGLIDIDRAVDETSSASQPRAANSNEIEGADTEAAGGEGGISIHDPQAGSFAMTALTHGVVGNITIYLVGLQNPITIIVNGKPSMFHRTVTLRVAAAGPQTDQSLLYQDTSVRLGMAQEPDLNNALYGISPTASETMVLEGDNGRAWIKGEHLYVQTTLAVFSPRVLATSHGNGKYRAYKLPKATRFTGTNESGKTVSVRVMRSPAVVAEQGEYK